MHRHIIMVLWFPFLILLKCLFFSILNFSALFVCAFLMIATVIHLVCIIQR